MKETVSPKKPKTFVIWPVTESFPTSVLEDDKFPEAMGTSKHNFGAPQCL